MNFAFRGALDGNGFRIKNISSQGTQYAGLFGCVWGGEIRNLGVASGNIQVSSNRETGTVAAGGIAAWVGGNGNIVNCFNSANITITATSSKGYVSAYAGGIFGTQWYNPRKGTGSISQMNSVTGCYNTGSVSVTAKATSTSSTGTGAEAFAGGIAANYYGSYEQKGLSRCYNLGNISATSYSTAGAGGAGAAGIVSNTYGSGMYYCCYNRGNISAEILQSSTTYGSNACAAGIADGGSVFDCYNSGAIFAKEGGKYTAAIASGVSFTSTAENCYNAGDIKVNGDIAFSAGVAFANTEGTIRNCYSLDIGVPCVSEDLGTGAIENAPALTDAQMRQQSSFVGFDFVNVWRMPEDGGPPVLR
ncbi:MAG: hypothetical protein LBJ11_00440 [Oscillospiraceae bacterium]|nr:hypothetical protein [Oscillospiraceae bacterium]